MKHHFADFVDRSGGHWSITPNADRFKHHLADVASAPKSTRILTITRNAANWHEAAKLPMLEELTLHEPSPAQLDFASTLWRLKRLRITHARPKDVAFLARLDNLEELVLEYVSGFDDLAPVGRLANLRALHLENLRRVRDFSGLRHAQGLRYLSIGGTLDWAQPVEDFSFLAALSRLEYLFFRGIRSLAEAPALLPLAQVGTLKKLGIPSYTFPLEEFALIEAAMPHVDGAVFAPCHRRAGDFVELGPDDIRSKLPRETLRANHPEVKIDHQGRRLISDPKSEWLVFLGKGERGIPAGSANAATRCAAHEARYRALVASMRDSLAVLRG